MGISHICTLKTFVKSVEICHFIDKSMRSNSAALSLLFGLRVSVHYRDVNNIKLTDKTKTLINVHRIMCSDVM